MFHVQRHDNASVIEVGSDLDCANSAALDSAIALAESGNERIVISLSNCDYCDSSGLSVIFRAKKRLGSRIVIVVPRDRPARKMFIITGTIEILDIREDLTTVLNERGLAS